MDDVLTIKVGEREWPVRPTFRVISAAERAAGVGAYALGLRISNAQSPISEMAAVIRAIIEASNPNEKKRLPSVEDVGEMLMEDGAGRMIAPLAELLLRAFMGNSSWRDAQAAKEADDPLSRLS